MGGRRQWCAGQRTSYLRRQARSTIAAGDSRNGRFNMRRVGGLWKIKFFGLISSLSSKSACAFEFGVHHSSSRRTLTTQTWFLVTVGTSLSVRRFDSFYLNVSSLRTGKVVGCRAAVWPLNFYEKLEYREFGVRGFNVRSPNRRLR